MTESTPPAVSLTSVFADDYRYFESNHAIFPDSASTVFGCVADLRSALQVFRGAADRGGPDGPSEDGVPGIVEMAEPVLLASSVGSVDESFSVLADQLIQ